MAHAQKEVENAAGNVKPIYRKLMGPTLEPPKKRLKDVEKEEGGELVLEERKAGWRAYQRMCKIHASASLVGTWSVRPLCLYAERSP